MSDQKKTVFITAAAKNVWAIFTCSAASIVCSSVQLPVILSAFALA
jgi:hypothetical protein